MKIKKLAAIYMAATIAIASIPLSASAHSNDKNYSIAVTSSNSGHHNGQFQNSYQAWEKKDNSTSSYVKANSGLSSFIAVIWGGWPNSETTDCTTYEIYSGSPRKSAVVRVGQKGYVRQDVYERYGGGSVTPVAQIFAKYNGVTGTTTGVWSPDSVAESGCIYFN